MRSNFNAYGISKRNKKEPKFICIVVCMLILRGRRLLGIVSKTVALNSLTRRVKVYFYISRVFVKAGLNL